MRSHATREPNRGRARTPSPIERERETDIFVVISCDERRRENSGSAPEQFSTRSSCDGDQSRASEGVGLSIFT